MQRPAAPADRSGPVAGAGDAPIIVTGANGFVGRVVVERLLDGGRSVVASDLHLDDFPPSEALRVVAGHLGSADVLAEMFREGCGGIIHLAAVPGGAAEGNPGLSRCVNVNATLDLLAHAQAHGPATRLVYASSIAVFGDRLPADGVDDATPINPRLVYGAHKAMMEVAVATAGRRSDVDGLSLRLPGVLARPRAPSGLKSAFMSDVFHALRASQAYVCPVSAQATIWAESVDRCADNLVAALAIDTALLPESRAVTLPALRIVMRDLVEAIARQTGRDPGLICYRRELDVEADFGRQPLLATPAADRAGLRHDGTLDALVERALARIARTDG